MSTSTSPLSRFLLSPYSGLQILLPAIAAQGLLQPFISTLSPRALALLLTIHHTAWLASVGTIGFLETPVKFRAPSLTQTAGIDVGRHVFSALNRVEIVAAVAGIGIARAWGGRLSASEYVVPAVLALQTGFLLPALVRRADKIIKGETVEKSSLHAIQVMTELVKLGALAMGVVRYGKYLLRD